MTETITLPADLARELTHAGVGQTRQGWTIVSDEHIENDDETEARRLVIRHDTTGQYYAGRYEDGKYIEPWEHTRPDFTPVVPVLTVVTSYVTPQVAQALAEQQDGAR